MSKHFTSARTQNESDHFSFQPQVRLSLASSTIHFLARICFFRRLGVAGLTPGPLRPLPPLLRFSNV